jgi:hypothetical protein
MAFDGRHYNSCATVGPIYAHPDAPATGMALSLSLQAAYCYARNAGALIGVQTHVWSLRRSSVYESIGIHSFSETDYVDLARFRRRKPAFATHACFETWYRLFPIEATMAFHRVKVTDADPTTVTGDEIETPYEPPAYSPTRRSRMHLWDPDHHVFGVTRGYVAVSTINDDEVVEVLVQGYAKGDSAVACAYRPEVTVAWWMTREGA